MASNDFPYEIYDAHHHLWNLDKIHFPWLATKGIKRFFGDPAPIQKNYLIADLQNDIGDLPVTKSVHIEVGSAPDQRFAESLEVQKMADTGMFANAIVAHTELEAEDVNGKLDRLQTLANLRGIRQIVGRSPDEDQQTGTGKLIANPQWKRGLKELARRGLSFDLQLIPDQLSAVARILEDVPELRIALCHAGSPRYRDQKGWEMWENGINEIATLPNAMCKISGLSMFDHKWTVDSLRPIIETVVKVFGAERVMFGSNFPVDKLHTRYKRLWNAYLEICDDIPALSASNKQSMFRDNCARFYRIN